MKIAWIVAVLLFTSCSGSTGSPPPSASTHIPGRLGDTWTRVGTAWHQATVGGPSPRYLASVAFDAPRHDYVLFGGETAKGTSDETWTWDGRRWTGMKPAHKPPPRRNAAMAYDPVHHLVVLYGGLIPDQAEGFEGDDTWTWDGTDWTEAGLSSAPGKREGVSMVTTSNGVLLFGGRIANVSYFGDAWAWNGATWTRQDNDRRPPGRSDAATAWDQARSSLVVFGGSGFNAAGGPGEQGTPLSDTWLLAGPGWVHVLASGSAPLSYANAIWDTTTKRVLVMFGIACPNPTNVAWAWDGAAWSKVGALSVPPRWGAAVAEDSDGNVLVFGGSDEAGC